MRSAAVLLALLLPFAATIGAQAPNSPPEVGPIIAELAPPRTVYSVNASDPDGDALEFVWEWAGGCGEFTSSGNRAVWSHPHPPCPDETFHPGTITVLVTDGRSPYVERAYGGGSASGVGDGDDPRDAPPPVIFGEEIECDRNSATGAFEASQGVWQDDELFADAPGKRLTWDETQQRFVAELPMVKDRPALLFGVRGDRYTIPYAPTLAGTVPGEAKVRFQLFEHGSGALRDLLLWPTDRYLTLPIYGACGPASTFPIPIEAPRGLPEEAAFTFGAAGDHDIIMELVDKHETPIPNTQVRLEGRTVEIPPFKLRLLGLSFAPTLRKPPAGSAEPYFVPGPSPPDELDSHLARLKGDVARFLPDYLPVAPGGIVVATTRQPASIIDHEAIRELCKAQDTTWNGDRAIGHLMCMEAHVRSALWSAEMVSMWTSGARMTIVVMPVASYSLATREISFGEAIADKLAIMLQNQAHWVVSHELVHAQPYPWANREECGIDFHHKGRYGNGFRITLGGEEHRMPRDEVFGIMTAESKAEEFEVPGPNIQLETKWIEQCTYAHLIDELQVPKDPPLVALALRLLRLGGNETAEILAARTYEGEPDVPGPTTLPYSVVFRGANGSVLARHTFEPSFEDESGAARPYALVALRVPRPSGAIVMDVEGPPGVLASGRLQGAAPVVRIEPPFNMTDARTENGTLVLRYRAEVPPPGIRVSYTVLASQDGETWRTLAHGVGANELRIDLAHFPPGHHFVRLIALDGVQSGEATIEFDTPLGPGVSPTPTPTGVPPMAEPHSRGGIPGPALALVAVAVAIAAFVRAARR